MTATGFMAIMLTVSIVGAFALVAGLAMAASRGQPPRRDDRLRAADLRLLASIAFNHAHALANVAEINAAHAIARAATGEITTAEARTIAKAGWTDWREAMVEAIGDFLEIPDLTEDDRVRAANLLIDLRAGTAEPSDCATLGMYR